MKILFFKGKEETHCIRCLLQKKIFNEWELCMREKSMASLPTPRPPPKPPNNISEPVVSSSAPLVHMEGNSLIGSLSTSEFGVAIPVFGSSSTVAFDASSTCVFSLGSKPILGQSVSILGSTSFGFGSTPSIFGIQSSQLGSPATTLRCSEDEMFLGQIHIISSILRVSVRFAAAKTTPLTCDHPIRYNNDSAILLTLSPTSWISSPISSFSPEISHPSNDWPAVSPDSIYFLPSLSSLPAISRYSRVSPAKSTATSPISSCKSTKMETPSMVVIKNGIHHIIEEILFQSFEDGCKVLGSLLDDVLQGEVGPQFLEDVERKRIFSQSAVNMLEDSEEEKKRKVFSSMISVNELFFNGQNLKLMMRKYGDGVERKHSIELMASLNLSSITV